MNDWGAPSDWGPLFDEFLLIYIAVFLTFKGIFLRRRTGVGRALARNNFALALAYYGAFAGSVLDWGFFQTEGWRWGARTLIAITLTHAIWELKEYFGGWKGLWGEIVWTFKEIGQTWCEWFGMGCYRIKRVFGRR